MKAIVVVDKNWGIGKNNDLLFSLKKDMKFFRETTLDKVVVMGSNTLKSFPNSKPLPRRTNIVLFPNGDKREDCVIVDSIEELKVELKKYNTEDIFIIGGAMFYKTMLDFCDTVFVTKVDSDGCATVFYPNLDSMDNWTCVYESEPIAEDDYVIKFTTYKNSKINNFFN